MAYESHASPCAGPKRGGVTWEYRLYFVADLPADRAADGDLATGGRRAPAPQRRPRADGLVHGALQQRTRITLDDLLRMTRSTQNSPRSRGDSRPEIRPTGDLWPWGFTASVKRSGG